MILRNYLLPLLALSAVVAPVRAQQHQSCPEEKIDVVQLPDLTIPRAGHETFVVGGEYVVAGGHTNGFVPTPTAEYYKDGKWQLMQMVYTHDFATALVLTSGQVLLAGGTAENIGVGQTFTAELYDPVSHRFDGFGSMDRKRAKASALELDSGKVVIAGNWYHDDGIELFDGKTAFSYVKDATRQRSFPYILRIAKDDALIISSRGNRDEKVSAASADRLHGDTVGIPLLETWQPLPDPHQFGTASFIGDEAQDDYAYLIPVEDSSGQVAIMKVENGRFALLPTVCPIPMQCRLGGIQYLFSIIVDRQRRRAYLAGINSDFRSTYEVGTRYYVLAIDYDQANGDSPAPLTLYYTDPQPAVFDQPPALTPDGCLLMTGGLRDSSNFRPSAKVFLLCTGRQSVTVGDSGSPWWLVIVLPGILLAVVLGCLVAYRKRRHPQLAEASEAAEAPVDMALIQRIRELMEREQLYLNSELKISDVAAALGVNRAYISESINASGGSFTQFVNSYRIAHAQQLLRTQPDIKLFEVWMSSGFSTERTFLRTFKAVTGLTPSEYRHQNDG
ncbi:MAG: helix-turn-helix transcriptional regulator [Prevotella sp.]|nr:helix-turn-helix transcriptional regulator [Prevotella sp.]